MIQEMTNKYQIIDSFLAAANIIKKTRQVVEFDSIVEKE